MSKSFFPITGQRVEPILKINDNDEVTSVQSRKNDASRGDPKVRIIRIVIGSLFKATMVSIDLENCKQPHTKRD
jgi:hypothetical protein